MPTSYDLVNLYAHPSIAYFPQQVGPFRVVFLNQQGEALIPGPAGGAPLAAVTARAFVDEPGVAKLALPPLADEKPEAAVWDLLLILSYLTGRRVMLPSDIGRFPLRNSFYPLADAAELFEAAQTAWSHRDAFDGTSRLPMLWLYLQAVTSTEAEVRGATASVAFENAVYDVERESGPAAGEDIADDLRDELRAVVRGRTDLSGPQKDRFITKVAEWGRPGLGALARQYAQHYDLATLADGSLDKKRVNHAADFRNGLLHEGTLRQPLWVKDDDPDLQEAYRKGVAVFYGAQLLPALVQLHLDRLFGIEGYEGPQRTAALVREYFASGTWDGDAVEEGATLS